METSYNVIARALDMYVHRERYAYFFGAKNVVLTDAFMHHMMYEDAEGIEYFKRYTDAQKKAIIDYSRGKIGLDCSGFVCTCFNCSSQWSGALIENCRVWDTPKHGKESSVLWKNGHVGVDIENG